MFKGNNTFIVYKFEQIKNVWITLCRMFYFAECQRNKSIYKEDNGATSGVPHQSVWMW